jgi:hypothetical protein
VTLPGDNLIARLAADGAASAAHELLVELFAGFPVEKLRPLLRSENDAVVKSAAWIVSELGEHAKPLMAELPELLAHPSRYVRFFILDAILAAGTTEDGQAIAAAVSAIRDPDAVVSWKAMNFLARASRDQLDAARPHLDGQSMAARVSRLIEHENVADTRALITELTHADRLHRLFATIAAARLATRDPSALRQAAESTEEEIRSFAEEHLWALEARNSSSM